MTTDYTCWGESELIERIHQLESKSDVKKYNDVQNMHAILVKYHGPTNTRGSRVSMYSYRFKRRVSISYDYTTRDIGEMAYNELVRRGFNIIGISEVKEGYILLSDTFDSIKA